LLQLELPKKKTNDVGLTLYDWIISAFDPRHELERSLLTLRDIPQHTPRNSRSI